MMSENAQDLDSNFEIISQPSIDQIENLSRIPSNKPDKFSEYRLEDANQRSIDEEQFGVETEIQDSCMRSNIQQEDQEMETENDVTNTLSPTHDEHDNVHDSFEGTTLLGNETPKLGMEFDDAEAAYEFYNRYGAKKGFSIKKDNIRTVKGVVKFRSFCCSKEGTRGVDKRRTNVVNHRLESRFGCKATMHIRLDKNGKFKISKLELDHNHTLASPGKTHMLRSQRKLGKVQKSLIDAADKSGLTPKQAFDYQATVVGGRENLSCLSMDVKNYLRTKRQKEMEKGDVASLLQYFHDKQVENKSFYYTFQVDNEEQITNIFWVDAKGIIDYGHFGDVICFDTTYKINNYGRPVAPLLGINHHKQTVFFAIAILYDETAESFKWLFECFLNVMSGVHPKIILTDQCAAMAKAIAKVFPNTHHRLCIWHIYQNACTNLHNVFSASKSFTSDFTSCIYDHEVEEDFDKAWNDMLKKYGLVQNEWLKDLFAKKEKWALVYGRNTFCADMMSTQRSESINAVLKRYLNSQYNFLRFFEHYDRLLANRRYTEYYADFITSQTRPVTCASSRILKQASEVYTNEIYKMFEEEYTKFLDCDAYRIGQTDGVEVYDIDTCVTNRSHKVTFDSVGTEVSCSCKKFEFVGILCSHALKVLDCNHIKLIPNRYIMKRWTKNAKIGNVNDTNGEKIQSDPSLKRRRRYGTLCNLMVRVATLAAEHEDTLEIAMENSGTLLERIEKRLKAITIGEASTEIPPVSVEGTTVVAQSDSEVLPSGIKRKENDRRRRRYPNPLEIGSKANKKKKAQNQQKCLLEKVKKTDTKNKRATRKEIVVPEECRQMNTMQPLPVLMTQVPEMMQLDPSHANNSLQMNANNMKQPMLSYTQLLQGIVPPNLDEDIANYPSRGDL